MTINSGYSFSPSDMRARMPLAELRQEQYDTALALGGASAGRSISVFLCPIPDACSGEKARRDYASQSLSVEGAISKEDLVGVIASVATHAGVSMRAIEPSDVTYQQQISADMGISTSDAHLLACFGEGLPSVECNATLLAFRHSAAAALGVAPGLLVVTRPCDCPEPRVCNAIALPRVSNTPDF